MKISTVVWLGDIAEKLLARHKVTQEEVREVLNGSPRFRYVEKGHRPGENVYAALGRTGPGRYLIVFFVYKGGRQALILSARDMTRGERKRYEEK
ncbi:MAG: BrnT family toxin [Candidatus Eisenbacteria bacterium]|nr:BrnT family toxin [Candidatus Eisenbacteria bacterium]